eukprot:4020153-Pyramimonas_sp.AAC.1
MSRSLVHERRVCEAHAIVASKYRGKSRRKVTRGGARNDCVARVYATRGNSSDGALRIDAIRKAPAINFRRAIAINWAHTMLHAEHTRDHRRDGLLDDVRVASPRCTSACHGVVSFQRGREVREQGPRDGVRVNLLGRHSGVIHSNLINHTQKSLVPVRRIIRVAQHKSPTLAVVRHRAGVESDRAVGEQIPAIWQHVVRHDGIDIQCAGLIIDGHGNVMPNATEVRHLGLECPYLIVVRKAAQSLRLKRVPLDTVAHMVFPILPRAKIHHCLVDVRAFVTGGVHPRRHSEPGLTNLTAHIPVVLCRSFPVEDHHIVHHVDPVAANGVCGAVAIAFYSGDALEAHRVRALLEGCGGEAILVGVWANRWRPRKFA